MILETLSHKTPLVLALHDILRVYVILKAQKRQATFWKYQEKKCFDNSIILLPILVILQFLKNYTYVLMYLEFRKLSKTDVIFF